MDEKCYIVAFQLATNANREALETAIKAYGTWARITENTWAVVTTTSATTVRNNLILHLVPQDRVFVIKSGIESAWKHVICRNEWLKENL